MVQSSPLSTNWQSKILEFISHLFTVSSIGRDMFLFQARLQNSEKRLLASTRVSVCLSVLMKQIGAHWTEYHQNLYLRIFLKSVKEVQVSLKRIKNYRYFT